MNRPLYAITTVSWPDASRTVRSVNLADENVFAATRRIIMASVSRGATITIEPGEDPMKYVVTYKGVEIDRINNDGHYEPGNLRWAHPVENQNNTRCAKGRERFLAFRKNFPHVRYADSTLTRLILQGFSDEEIVERWNTPSHKPKGKYGTSSMQGPYRDLPQTDD